ncbi:PD-(D/E)XK nuclease domain-containing protein [uncultured Victivallis sp.]|uniref:PD-(D/E)XK nuclease domain-containing protein n=1 Tax=uncultured Victivallis sp. TaxID=354118 RepID=UPI0025F43F5A|nr:PD-(D/E)XK nuclease domain-containing protein [uncultured Victivallis sp.]
MSIGKRSSTGRIDAAAMCGEWVYHYEFKINRNAECALDQIKKKEYFRKYQHSGKRLILIGANFNMGTRQLDDGKGSSPD